MFILWTPVYKKGVKTPVSWDKLDEDPDYGELLKRNLQPGATVGAVNFGLGLTYIVFVDESILKVEYIADEAT